MNETAFFSIAKPLVCLHAAAAVVLIGASTHHTLVALGHLRGRYRIRLGRIYAATVVGAYLATLLVGALAYPTYRYHVRGLFLDRYAVWASNLFDIKENIAIPGLALAIAAMLLGRVLEPKDDRTLAIGYACFVSLSAAIVWFDFFSGLLITMAKSV